MLINDNFLTQWVTTLDRSLYFTLSNMTKSTFSQLFTSMREVSFCENGQFVYSYRSSFKSCTAFLLIYLSAIEFSKTIRIISNYQSNVLISVSQTKLDFFGKQDCCSGKLVLAVGFFRIASGSQKKFMSISRQLLMSVMNQQRQWFE